MVYLGFIHKMTFDYKSIFGFNVFVHLNVVQNTSLFLLWCFLFYWKKYEEQFSYIE